MNGGTVEDDLTDGDAHGPILVPGSGVGKRTVAAVRADPTCCVGIGAGDRVYAPHGLDDVWGLVLRPNPVVASREVYEEAASYRARWPEPTGLPWP